MKFTMTRQNLHAGLAAVSDNRGAEPLEGPGLLFPDAFAGEHRRHVPSRRAALPSGMAPRCGGGAARAREKLGRWAY